MLLETRLRLEAIQHVLAVRERWTGVPASEVSTFMSTAGQRIFLKSIQGVFKPAQLTLPLSITTTLASPYADKPIDGNRVLYNFAPRSADNDSLKRCAEGSVPLIYFLQTKPKPRPEYIVFAPVFVVGWDDAESVFMIDLSEQRAEFVAHSPFAHQFDLSSIPMPGSPLEIRELTKSYSTTIVQRRLHQARFRNQILAAYRCRCAVCVLRIRPLLDAAHVVPDRDPSRVILVNEGLALCATHHRAFDAKILRYDEHYKVRVELPARTTIGAGEETMLVAFDGQPLTLPANDQWWPRPL